MFSAGTRHKATAVVVAVAFLLAGIGNSVAVVNQDQVTTGHTRLISGSSGFSDCMAGVAGLMKQKVTWFNGQTLFERATGAGKFVYLTEHFDPSGDTVGDVTPYEYDDETGIRITDPSNEKLFRTNNTFRFHVPTDPNDPSDNPDDPEHAKEWVVREYFALREVDPTQDISGPKRVYVYVVEVAEGTFTADILGDAKYNFASIIDTCRFHGSATDDHRRHSPDGDRDQSQLEGDQHDYSEETEHNHSAYAIDIWVGDEPDEVPLSQEISENTSDGGGGSS